MSFFDAIEALFAPSRRHQQEERNRLELTRDEVGLGDPHRGPIDLDSGVVKLRRPQPAGDDAGDDR
jgi:Family of unknown function (DUF6191)